MGCMNIVIYLLQHDASPDIPTVRGETPLHLAARANQVSLQNFGQYKFYYLSFILNKKNYFTLVSFLNTFEINMNCKNRNK